MTEESKWKYVHVMNWCDKHQRWVEDIWDLRMVNKLFNVTEYADLNCEHSCYCCEFRKSVTVPDGFIV